MLQPLAIAYDFTLIKFAYGGHRALKVMPLAAASYALNLEVLLIDQLMT